MRSGGVEIHLTPIEFDLLRTLMRNRGRLLTHRALLLEVWGPGYADDTATLRTHMSNLRRKLGDQARHLRTDRESATGSGRKGPDPLSVVRAGTGRHQAGFRRRGEPRR